MRFGQAIDLTIVHEEVRVRHVNASFEHGRKHASFVLRALHARDSAPPSFVREFLIQNRQPFPHRYSKWVSDECSVRGFGKPLDVPLDVCLQEAFGRLPNDADVPDRVSEHLPPDTKRRISE
jgi:hypothetical protein